jgi:conjugal transfer/type IV secretion protein DotA/TraY
MVNLFTYTSGDQSVAYLSQLFGSIGTILPVTATTVLGTMFKTLNTTALVLGSILVVHTTVVGLLKTAQEGEFLGKQWNSLWVPLRTVMGIAALFPTSTGYSILQVLMMWFILQGVGAADTLWSTVLSYINTTGSPYSTAGALKGPTMGVSQNMQTIFDSLVCQAEARITDPILNINVPKPYPYIYYCGNPNNASKDFCQRSQDDMTNVTTGPQVTTSGGIVTYAIGPPMSSGGACGKLQYGDPKTYRDPAFKSDTAPVCSYNDSSHAPEMLECAGLVAAVPSLQAVISTLATLAVTFATNDTQYMNFYNLLSPTPVVTPPDWIMNFCSANNLSKQQCCLYNSSAMNAALKATATCQDESTQTTFPPYNNVISGATDITNTSVGANGATRKLYLPYAIQPAVGDNTDLVSEATSNYIAPITAAIIAAGGNVSLPEWETEAQDTGWILAGSYYYKIAGMTTASMKLPPLSAIGSDPLHDSSNPMNPFRNNYEAADDLLQTQAVQPGISTSAPPQMAGVSNALNSAASNITSNFMQEISGSRGGNTVTNPLVNAAGFGESLLITAQVVYPVVMAIAVGLLIFTNVAFIELGSGVPTNPWSTAGQFLVWGMIGITGAFCGWCITFGSMLGIYTPLVPYILFVFGALGWLIATLEAMVASPFVALGILSPGGQHEILGRAEPALMIILNTFLRPSLMIFGMMGGMLLAPIAVSMVNFSFQGVMGSINQNPGPVEMIIFMSAYAILIITVMNKCFALIHMVPDRVLSWIGGHGGSAGQEASQGLGEVKSGTEAAADAAGKAAEGGADATVAAGKEVFREGEANKKDKAESDLRAPTVANARMNAAQHAKETGTPYQEPFPFEPLTDGISETGEITPVETPTPTAGGTTPTKPPKGPRRS